MRENFRGLIGCRLASREVACQKLRMSPAVSTRKFTPLDELVHEQIDEEDYKHKLKQEQIKLLELQRSLEQTERSLVIVLEGPDAAGKGGAIKRVVERLDPRVVRVYSIIKPTEEEFRHHYMWRFWTKLPGDGDVAIFDRSWYGRVLVERVEGFATEDEWRRAYREINEFEKTLTDAGTVIVKFYLHITKDEQLERFKKRESDPLKHWKISDEDWRNRKKWDEHNLAAQEMFARTSMPNARWHVFGANYKRWARLKVVKTVVKALEKAGLP